LQPRRQQTCRHPPCPAPRRCRRRTASRSRQWNDCGKRSPSHPPPPQPIPRRGWAHASGTLLRPRPTSAASGLHSVDLRKADSHGITSTQQLTPKDRHLSDGRITTPDSTVNVFFAGLVIGTTVACPRRRPGQRDAASLAQPWKGGTACPTTGCATAFAELVQFRGAGNPARSRLSGGFFRVVLKSSQPESPAESRLQPRLAAPQLLCLPRTITYQPAGAGSPPGLRGGSGRDRAAQFFFCPTSPQSAPSHLVVHSILTFPPGRPGRS